MNMKTTKWIAASLMTLAAVVNGVGHAQGGADSFSSINLGGISGQTGVLPLSGTNFMMLRFWSDVQLTILAGAARRSAHDPVCGSAPKPHGVDNGNILVPATDGTLSDGHRWR